MDSDKASMGIPSGERGVVKEVAVKLGDRAKQGSAVDPLEAAGSAVSATVSFRVSVDLERTLVSVELGSWHS